MHRSIRIIGLAAACVGTGCGLLEDILDDQDEGSTGDSGEDDEEDGEDDDEDDENDGDDDGESGVVDASTGESPTGAESNGDASATSTDDSGGSGPTDDDGTTSTGPVDPTDAEESDDGLPVDCPAAGSCDACVQCSMAENCAAQADTCALDPECVEIRDCALGCVALVLDLAAYTQCIDGCSSGHPAGEPEFFALLGCLENICYDTCV